MPDLEKLIKKHGHIKNVPNDVLEAHGYVRVRGRVLSIAEIYDDQEFDIALGLKENTPKRATKGDEPRDILSENFNDLVARLDTKDSKKLCSALFDLKEFVKRLGSYPADELDNTKIKGLTRHEDENVRRMVYELLAVIAGCFILEKTTTQNVVDILIDSLKAESHGFIISISGSLEKLSRTRDTTKVIPTLFGVYPRLNSKGQTQVEKVFVAMAKNANIRKNAMRQLLTLGQKPADAIILFGVFIQALPRQKSTGKEFDYLNEAEKLEFSKVIVTYLRGSTLQAGKLISTDRLCEILLNISNDDDLKNAIENLVNRLGQEWLGKKGSIKSFRPFLREEKTRKMLMEEISRALSKTNYCSPSDHTQRILRFLINCAKAGYSVEEAKKAAVKSIILNEIHVSRSEKAIFGDQGINDEDFLIALVLKRKLDAAIRLGYERTKELVIDHIQDMKDASPDQLEKAKREFCQFLIRVNQEANRIDRVDVLLEGTVKPPKIKPQSGIYRVQQPRRVIANA